MKDLAISLYKFSSIATPLRRCAQALHAVCSEAQSIWSSRDTGSDESQAAIGWAKWLTLKHCVLLGFMADAGSDGMELVRTWEPEDSEVAEYMEEARGLLTKQIVLFKNGGAKETGYGAKLIDELKRRDILFIFPDGKTKILKSSDVTDELIEECLDVMIGSTCLKWQSMPNVHNWIFFRHFSACL